MDHYGKQAFFFFNFMCLPACKHVCCMNALCSTEEGVRSLGAGVTGDCEMSAHLQEQKVLTAKLSCPPSRGPADKFLKHLMYSFHCEVDFRRCGAF